MGGTEGKNNNEYARANYDTKDYSAGEGYKGKDLEDKYSKLM